MVHNKCISSLLDLAFPNSHSLIKRDMIATPLLAPSIKSCSLLLNLMNMSANKILKTLLDMLHAPRPPNALNPSATPLRFCLCKISGTHGSHATHFLYDAKG